METVPFASHRAHQRLKIYTVMPLLCRELSRYQESDISLFYSIEGFSLRTLEVPLGFFYVSKVEFYEDCIVCKVHLVWVTKSW